VRQLLPDPNDEDCYVAGPLLAVYSSTDPMDVIRQARQERGLGSPPYAVVHVTGLDTLLLVASILALVFGLGFLLAPDAILPLYALQPEPDTVLMSRFFGTALVQLGAALYLVRDVREPATRRGLVVAGLAGRAWV
jgi:uncharacterized protein YjeT (DUF2065 family)